MENKESFVELYTRLYNENFNELEKLRQKDAKTIKTIFYIIGVIFMLFIGISMLTIGTSSIVTINGESATMIGFIISAAIRFPIIVIVIIVLALFISNALKNGKVINNLVTVVEKASNEKVTYKSMFKEKVIAPIIKHALVGSEYHHNVGLTEEEYNQGHWEKYDRYSSEDKIITNIKLKDNIDINLEFKIAEVHTEDRHEDDEGHVSYSTVFHGLAGSIKLPKDAGCYLKVEKNGFNFFGGPKDRLEMDMSEFEKIFDVKTDDRIKAMQILTVDIMAELINLVKTSKVKFEFYINHDIMHIRFHTGEMFEPDVFGKSMQLDKLRKCFDKIEAVKNVAEHICNVIKETEL